MSEAYLSRVALQQLVSLMRAPRYLDIGVTSCLLASTGAQLGTFADGASATPGVQITDSETWGVRWNNHATPTAIAKNIMIPRNIDTSAIIRVYFDVSKTGATLADATTITVAAYITDAGDLHDGDSNCGGVTGAVVGDLTAKTKSLLYRDIAVADIAASLPSGGPGTLALSFGPTAGLLGTDDFVIHAAWLEFTTKYVA